MAAFLGEGGFELLLDEIKKQQYRKILVVTGRKSFDKSGMKKQLLAELHDSELHFFSDFSPNVKFEESVAGCRKAESLGIEAVLAIGGGSVIDMAKIISLMPKDSAVLKKMILGREEISGTMPLYCAPTTSGSGSEATHFAVIYMGGKKYSLASHHLLAESVAVDPRLSSSMPPYLTACSGFDALSQAIESFWAAAATDKSREYAAKAIALILPALEKAVNDPCAQSRNSMAEGAYYAGKAINISKTTAPHAFSYYLTSVFNLPHGHAVAIFTGVFFKINSEKIPPELYRIMGCRSADECCALWYEMMDRCGLEYRMKGIGIPESECEKIVDSVNLERLRNNPVNPGREFFIQHLKEFYGSF
jgi:alcohol dehydrogenase class IV